MAVHATPTAANRVPRDYHPAPRAHCHPGGPLSPSVTLGPGTTRTHRLLRRCSLMRRGSRVRSGLALLGSPEHGFEDHPRQPSLVAFGGPSVVAHQHVRDLGTVEHVEGCGGLLLVYAQPVGTGEKGG